MQNVVALDAASMALRKKLVERLATERPTLASSAEDAVCTRDTRHDCDRSLALQASKVEPVEAASETVDETIATPSAGTEQAAATMLARHAAATPEAAAATIDEAVLTTARALVARSRIERLGAWPKKSSVLPETRASRYRRHTSDLRV